PHVRPHLREAEPHHPRPFPGRAGVYPVIRNGIVMIWYTVIGWPLWRAGSNFHRFPASIAALRNGSSPRIGFTSPTEPSAMMITLSTTVPDSFAASAVAGYCGFLFLADGTGGSDAR